MSGDITAMPSDESFLIREVKRDLAYIKAELRDSDARYKSWKDILSEECRGNEEHFKAKLSMVQNRFVSLVEELKVSVSNCQAEVSLSREDNMNLIEAQSKHIVQREDAHALAIEGVKEFLAKSMKDQSAKASKETASVADVFLKRMDEERETMFRTVRQSNETAARRIEELNIEVQHDYRNHVEDTKEKLTATFSKNMSEQRLLLEQAFTTGISVLEDKLSEKFNKRMETQRSMLESNFLQGMDKLEAWLKRQNEKRDTEIESLRSALKEQQDTFKRSEDIHCEHRLEMEEWAKNKMGALVKRITNDQDRSNRELERFGTILQDKDDFFSKMKESLCSNQTRMVKDCLMLNIRVNALQDKSDKQTVAYNDFMQDYEKIKTEMDRVLDTQKATFESYEDKVLQHASDFQSYLDEHASATDEMQSRFAELAEEFDQIQESVRQQSEMVETSKELAAQMHEGRQADCTRIAKMGKTWESLYAHLAAQVQDYEDSQARALEGQEEYQTALETRLIERDELVDKRFEQVDVTVQEHVTHTQSIDQKVDEARTSVGAIRESLGDFSIEQFEKLSQDLVELKDNVEGVRQLRDTTQSCVDTVAVELGKQIGDVASDLRDKVSTADLAETTRSQKENLATEIKKYADDATEHLLRTERLEIASRQHGNQLGELADDLSSFKGKEFSALTKTVETQERAIVTVDEVHKQKRAIEEDRLSSLRSKVEALESSVEQMALETEVKQAFETRDSQFKERAEQVNQMVEKGKARCDKIEASVDRCGLKVDVLQGNLGSINIKMFNDLQNKVSGQTKALYLDKQERIFTQERVDSLEQKMDDRMKELLVQKPWKEAHDGLKQSVEQRDSEMTQTFEEIKEKVEESKLTSKSLESNLQSCNEKLSTLEDKGAQTLVKMEEVSATTEKHSSDIEELKNDHGKTKLNIVTMSKHFGSFVDEIVVKLGFKASKSSVDEIVSAQKALVDGKLDRLSSSVAEHSTDIEVLKNESASHQETLSGLESVVQQNWESFAGQVDELEKVRSDMTTLKDYATETRDDLSSFQSVTDQKLRDVTVCVDAKASAESVNEQFGSQRAQLLAELSFTALLANECKSKIKELQEQSTNHDAAFKSTQKSLAGWNSKRFETLSKTVKKHDSKLLEHDSKHQKVETSILSVQNDFNSQLEVISGQVERKANKETLDSRMEEQRSAVDSQVKKVQNATAEHDNAIAKLQNLVALHREDTLKFQASLGAWDHSAIGALSEKLNQHATEIGSITVSRDRSIADTNNQVGTFQSALRDLAEKLDKETSRLEKTVQAKSDEIETKLLGRIGKDLESLWAKSEALQSSIDDSTKKIGIVKEVSQSNRGLALGCENAIEHIKENCAQMEHVQELKEAIDSISGDIKSQVSPDVLLSCLKRQESKILARVTVNEQESAEHHSNVMALENRITTLRTSVETMAKSILDNVELVISEHTKKFCDESDGLKNNIGALSDNLGTLLQKVSSEAEEATTQAVKESMKVQATYESYLKDLSGKVEQKANEEDVNEKIQKHKSALNTQVSEISKAVDEQKHNILSLRTDVETHKKYTSEFQESFSSWSKTSIHSLNEKLDQQAAEVTDLATHKSRSIEDAQVQTTEFKANLDELSKRLDHETSRLNLSAEQRAAAIKAELTERLEMDIQSVSNRSDDIQKAIQELTCVMSEQKNVGVSNMERVVDCEKAVKQLQDHGAQLEDLQRLREVMTEISSELHSKVSSDAFHKALNTQESEMLIRLGAVEHESAAGQQQATDLKLSLSSLRKTVDVLIEEILTSVAQVVAEQTEKLNYESKGIQESTRALTQGLDKHLMVVSSQAEGAAEAVLNESKKVQAAFESYMANISSELKQKANEDDVNNKLDRHQEEFKAELHRIEDDQKRAINSLREDVESHKLSTSEFEESFGAWSKTSITTLSQQLEQQKEVIEKLNDGEDQASSFKTSLDELAQKLERQTEKRATEMKTQIIERVGNDIAVMSARGDEIQCAIDELTKLMSGHELLLSRDSGRIDGCESRIEDLQKLRKTVSFISSGLQAKVSSETFESALESQENKILSRIQSESTSVRNNNVSLEKTVSSLRETVDVMSDRVLENIAKVVSDRTFGLKSQAESSMNSVSDRSVCLTDRLVEVSNQADDATVELMKGATSVQAAFESYFNEVTTQLREKANEKDVDAKFAAQEEALGEKVAEVVSAVDHQSQVVASLRTDFEQQSADASTFRGAFGNWSKTTISSLTEQVAKQNENMSDLHARSIKDVNEQAVGFQANLDDLSKRLDSETSRLEASIEHRAVEIKTELRQQIVNDIALVSSRSEDIRTSIQDLSQAFSDHKALNEANTGRLDSWEENLKAFEAHGDQLRDLEKLRELMESVSSELKSKVSSEEFLKALDSQGSKFATKIGFIGQESAHVQKNIVMLEASLKSLRDTVEVRSDELLTNIAQTVAEQTGLLRDEDALLKTNIDHLALSIDERLAIVSSQAEDTAVKVTKESEKVRAAFDAFFEELSGEVKLKANEADVAAKFVAQEELFGSRVAEVISIVDQQKSAVTSLRSEFDNEKADVSEFRDSFGNWSKRTISSLTKQMSKQAEDISGLHDEKTRSIAASNEQVVQLQTSLNELSRRLDSETTRLASSAENYALELKQQIEKDSEFLSKRYDELHVSIQSLSQLLSDQGALNGTNEARMNDFELSVKVLETHGERLKDLEKLHETMVTFSVELNKKVSSDEFVGTLDSRERHLLTRFDTVEQETVDVHEHTISLERSLKSLRDTVQSLSDELLNNVAQAIEARTDVLQAENTSLKANMDNVSQNLVERLAVVSNQAEDAVEQVMRESKKVQRTFETYFEELACEIKEKADGHEVKSRMVAQDELLERHVADIHSVVDTQEKAIGKLQTDFDQHKVQTDSRQQRTESMIEKVDVVAVQTSILQKKVGTCEENIDNLGQVVSQVGDEILNEVSQVVGSQTDALRSGGETIMSSIEAFTNQVDTELQDIASNIEEEREVAMAFEQQVGAHFENVSEKIDGVEQHISGNDKRTDRLEAHLLDLTTVSTSEKSKVEALEREVSSKVAMVAERVLQVETDAQEAVNKATESETKAFTVTSLLNQFKLEMPLAIRQLTNQVTSTKDHVNSVEAALQKETKETKTELLNRVEELSKQAGETRQGTDVLASKVKSCEMELGVLDHRVETTRKERRAIECGQTEAIDSLKRKVESLVEDVEGKVPRELLEAKVRQQESLNEKLQNLEEGWEHQVAQTIKLQHNLDRLDHEVLSIKSDVTAVVEERLTLQDQETMYMMKAEVMAELEEKARLKAKHKANKKSAQPTSLTSSTQDTSTDAIPHQGTISSNTVEQKNEPVKVSNKTTSKSFVDSTEIGATKGDAVVADSASKTPEIVGVGSRKPTKVAFETLKEKGGPEKTARSKKRRGKLQALIALRDDLKQSFPVVADEARSDSIEMCTAPSEEPREH